LVNTANAQPTTVAQADRLQLVLRNSKPDTNRVKALLKLSDFYLNKTIDPARDLDSALTLVRQAKELSKSHEFAKGMEDADFLKGKIYIYKQNTGFVHSIFESLSDTNRIKLLLELGKYHLWPSYTQNVHLDSALFFFRKAESLSEAKGNQKWKEESQLQIGTYYLNQGDFNQGKPYFMQVIESRQKAGDKAGEAIAWFRMLANMVCKDEVCEAQMRDYFAQSLTITRQLKDQSLEAMILLGIGTRSILEGNLKQAEQYTLQALAIQKAIGYPSLYRASYELSQLMDRSIDENLVNLSNAYYPLAELSFHKGDLNKALFYILQAIKDIESSGITHQLDYAYFRLGNVYFELGQLDKSIEYHQQSLAISHQHGKAIVLLALAKKMSRALMKQGRALEALQLLQDFIGKNLRLDLVEKTVIAQSLGECYANLKQYKKAEKHYLQSIAWSKKIGEEVHKLVNYLGISRFYVASSQYTKATPYLKELLSAPQGQIPTNILMEIHLMRFKVDSAGASYPSAIKHYQLYKALNDSIFNETKSKQIEELSIGYETEKKEQELKLKEKNIALLKEQSKVQHTQRNALIGGTALLLLMLGLVYNRFRLKIRSNKLLEAQQAVLQNQQKVIQEKNGHLSELLSEKDSLIGEKDSLLAQKDTLLMEKDLLLTEKEWLLKEIHHRVKNNLQVVMSLLDSQADSLIDKAALSAIQESQHRVQAMALIHQKLYQSESLARIPMSSYIEEVVAYLSDSYSLYQPIRFDVEVEDIELDVTLAVPLGLIINEAITNAFKYAFPNGRSGTITVRLQRIEEASYELIVADDGVGLPASYDPSRSRSLGMTLIHGFSRQLGAKLNITNHQGLSFSLLFQEEQLIRAYA
jgi:two-component sensor histidine kinase